MVKLKIQPALDDITDVTLTSPADNEVLKYDSASALWGNEIQSAADVSIALGTGSPIVDKVQEYIDNTGSSGYFTVPTSSTKIY
ncbi:MAG TPA: hypothetical protein ENI23_07630 [bacterium]|nr:hypothetical protein [bacterium]